MPWTGRSQVLPVAAYVSMQPASKQEAYPSCRLNAKMRHVSSSEYATAYSRAFVV